MTSEVLTPLRKWRTDQRLTLETVCERFAEAGFERPSTAKLSRMERRQGVSLDDLPAVQAVTGLAAEQLMPEAAKFFNKGEGGVQ